VVEAGAPAQIKPVFGLRDTTIGCRWATGRELNSRVAADFRDLRVVKSLRPVKPVPYTYSGLPPRRETTKATRKSSPPLAHVIWQQCCAASIKGAAGSGTSGPESTKLVTRGGPATPRGNVTTPPREGARG